MQSVSHWRCQHTAPAQCVQCRVCVRHSPLASVEEGSSLSTAVCGRKRQHLAHTRQFAKVNRSNVSQPHLVQAPCHDVVLLQLLQDGLAALLINLCRQGSNTRSCWLLRPLLFCCLSCCCVLLWLRCKDTEGKASTTRPSSAGKAVLQDIRVEGSMLVGCQPC